MVAFQIVRGGVCVGVAVFPDGATAGAGGASVTWSDGALDLPAGEIAISQAGAAVGWRLVNGALVAPGVTVNALRAYAGAKADSLRAGPRSYALPGGLSVLADASTPTGTDLIGLMTWGQANAAATTNWVDDNGGVVTLTGAQCVALADAVLAYGQSVYAVLAQAMNGVANQSIATTAEIDALSWPA